jgi:catechol 2,3-dioxygenase-like lactoylglutathione lyase family enzyme
MTLNHVHLGSTRFAEAQAFYQRYFGFKVVSQHGQGVFMKDQEGFLLVLDPASESHSFPTWFHLGFCQSNERAVHEFHATFQSAGVPLARQLLFEPGEYASFYVQDPDGVRIEVSWHAE